ncbi:hypothetical protein SpCBS45565_g04538 [Spizellomyces sp. 'palustris']|nr:hypothetical protein SpCBS45565_g04538 [Spizellomyces sp. 'palustris']
MSLSLPANLQSIFRTISGSVLASNQQQTNQQQQARQQQPTSSSSNTSMPYGTPSQPSLASVTISPRQSESDMQVDDYHHDHHEHHHHYHHEHDHDGEWDEEGDYDGSDVMDDGDDGDDGQSGGAGDGHGSEQSTEDKEQEAKLHQHQSDLRKRIVMIQQDNSIPPADKARRIQELMTHGWSQKQQSRSTVNTRVTNRLENRRSNFNELTDADRQPTYHDKASGILGCKHYQRAAKLQAHCCGKWDTCRFCHDEVSDHNIVRNLITTMMCMYCSTVQPAGQDCINEKCGRRVAKYYCKECKLWDSDPRKNIYHCYDCGICRIGKGLGIDYFHCKKCNVCMAISLKGRHKCIERNLESDCPICGEYMFTSTTTVIFMPCGHCIHYKCHQDYIQTSYQCPTCLKSLADMSDYFRRIDIALAQQQMPPEYADLLNQIYCNDCEKKCYAKFHFMYHKCVTCKGYNTKVLHTVDASQVPPDQLKLVLALNVTAEGSSPASPTTAVNPEPPEVTQEEVTGRASVGGRSSTSRRASMVQRGVTYFCHQCQAATNPVMVAGTQRCGTCDSDFLEQL